MRDSYLKHTVYPNRKLFNDMILYITTSSSPRNLNRPDKSDQDETVPEQHPHHSSRLSHMFRPSQRWPAEVYLKRGRAARGPSPWTASCQQWFSPSACRSSRRRRCIEGRQLCWRPKRRAAAVGTTRRRIWSGRSIHVSMLDPFFPLSATPWIYFSFPLFLFIIFPKRRILLCFVRKKRASVFGQYIHTYTDTHIQIYR